MNDLVEKADHCAPGGSKLLKAPWRFKFRLDSWFRKSLFLWPLMLPVLILLPALGTFPYPNESAAYSDLAITHYPNAEFLKQAVAETHRLPLWSNTILSGYPFFANPLSGLWYPPGWVALLFPLPLGFNLLVVAHLVLGGIGMYKLLRSEGLSRWAALFGGVAFTALPKLFAHYGAGHLTLLYAVPWTPWLLYASRWKLDSSPGSRWGKTQRFGVFFTPGVLLALIFLADVRWFVFGWILWFAYEIAYSHLPDQKSVTPRLLLGKNLVGQTVLAGMLCAPLALPLWEYTQLSTRSDLAIADAFSYSLPAARLLGLIVPDFGGFHEWALYPGAMVLILAVIAFVGRSSSNRRIFWLGVFVLSLLFSLGSQIPLLETLMRLPGLNLLRVPPRALFLSGMSLIVLAAIGFDQIEKGLLGSRQRPANLALLALSGFVICLLTGVWLLTGNLPLNFLWGGLAVVLSSVWVLSYRRFSQYRMVWFAGVLLIGLLDWTIVNSASFSPRSANEVFSQGEAAARYLSSQPGNFRVYSPSFSLPQQTAVRYGLELADGVDPLQLTKYVNYMERASGVPRTGYSVTLPPFKAGEPAMDNAEYLPDPSLLGRLNVKYVASEFELDVQGLVERARFGQTRIYENLESLPRAWVQGELNATQPGIPAEILVLEPDRLLLRAIGPGFLVVSEINYPHWQVWVDGEESTIQEVDDLFRWVQLPPGAHQVELRFLPTSLYLGFVLCLVGLAALVMQLFTIRDGR